MTLTDIGAEIDAIAASALERQHLPGLSIVVARHGATIVARGYGKRNVGEDLPATADTIYSIASISKQFTAAAMLVQAERGRLRLDDRVSRYFPWHPYGESIELRHLLSHTSGMPDYFPLETVDRIGFAAATPREIAQTVLDRPPAFAPGAEYQYCNTGYVLLGAILEAVSGESYADHLQRLMFDPLEMTRTGVDDVPVVRSNVAVGLTSYLLGPWELARDYDPSWEFGTGGLFSSVNDLLTWNTALRAGKIVSPASFAQMTTAVRLRNGHRVNYGFGLSVGDAGGRRELRHTGGLPGISTDNSTYPDDGIDIVVFVNHDGVSTYNTITRPILALLLGEPGLRSGRVTDPDASSGLSERPEGQRYLCAAAAGEIDELPLTPRFERFLTPRRRARFAALPALGTPRNIALLDAARRDPETTFTYRVDFAAGPLVATLTLRDDGGIAGLNFVRWDDRGPTVVARS